LKGFRKRATPLPNIFRYLLVWWGKSGELKAPEGLKAALRRRVLEETLLGRSRFLFIFTYLASGIIKSLEANSPKGAFMYLIFAHKKAGRAFFCQSIALFVDGYAPGNNSAIR